MNGKKLSFTVVFCMMMGLFQGGVSANVSQEGEELTLLMAADQYFFALTEIMDKDNGALWGQKLDAPILVVDMLTRKVIASEEDAEGYLVKEGNYYTGILPDDSPIANTNIHLGGKDYAMIILQFMDEEDTETKRLLAHEQFHVMQEAIGHTPVSNTKEYDNSHLDELDARILIRLEWAALDKALLSTGAQQIAAIRHALCFREARREAYTSAADENAHETQEGLAEYTAFRLVHATNSTEAIEIITSLQPDFSGPIVRNFGYYSGPRYGYLLDQFSAGWQQDIEYGSDLGDLLKSACKIAWVPQPDRVWDNYEYGRIDAFERNRYEEIAAIISEYTKLYTEKPLLLLPTGERRYSFNPNLVQPFSKLGTLYPKAVLYGDWGKLDATESAFVIPFEPDKNIFTSATQLERVGEQYIGNGWVLDLYDGYTVAARGDGNYEVIRGQDNP